MFLIFSMGYCCLKHMTEAYFLSFGDWEQRLTQIPQEKGGPLSKFWWPGMGSDQEWQFQGLASPLASWSPSRCLSWVNAHATLSLPLWMDSRADSQNNLLRTLFFTGTCSYSFFFSAPPPRFYLLI